MYDLLIIGGGINGTAIARDAAGKGLKVLLCERDDLAGHTSSASTKLIHGGLRYLEYYEFNLVRHALAEREVMLRSAPHIIWPMRFVLPYDKGLRPAWMLRTGLFLYDHIGGREMLPGSKSLKLDKAPHKGVLESRFKTGFEYSDCWVDDARLVVLYALDASHRGADIRTRTEVQSVEAAAEGYQVQIKHAGEVETVHAKGIINSAGPWVDEVLKKIKRTKNEQSLRLVTGSHIVTKKLYEGRHLYMFQNPDKRIIFAIPYEQDYTLIGTTDEPYKISDGEIKISSKETNYLLKAASEYFAKPVTKADIVWDYAGVRPLYDNKKQNASAVTRDYVFDLKDEDTPPILSIFGGKITTYRELAEHALEKLEKHFPKMGGDWTAKAVLPGGDIPDADFDAFLDGLLSRFRWLEPSVLRRLARAYGTRIEHILGDAKSKSDLGRDFGGGLFEAEARYLIKTEWAKTSEDILWRRSKYGLHMEPEEIAAFAAWFSGVKF